MRVALRVYIGPENDCYDTHLQQKREGKMELMFLCMKKVKNIYIQRWPLHGYKYRRMASRLFVACNQTSNQVVLNECFSGLNSLFVLNISHLMNQVIVS